MNQQLSKDQFEALDQVSKLAKSAKPSACIARNAKHLIGIKLLVHRKDGSYALTEKGTEALFVKSCIAGLRAVADQTDAKLAAPVATFLMRKAYIAAGEMPGQFAITPKGRECLEDIAQNP